MSDQRVIGGPAVNKAGLGYWVSLKNLGNLPLFRMASGKCPKCGETLARLKYEDVLADGSGRRDVRAYTLRCGECDTIIAAALHPKVLGVMDRSSTG